MKSMRTVIGAASMLALAATAAPASAATFVLNGINSIGDTRARDGFLTAANYWANTLTDDVTVVLNVGFSNLGTSPNGTVLGQTSSTLYSALTNVMIGQIIADRTSALDTVASASLASILTTGLSFNKPGYVSGTLGVNTDTQIFDNDGSANNQRLLGTGANLKALGFTGFTAADGTITFNSAVNFDFDPRNGVSRGALDFVGVAIHEFGHALGFTSRVDLLDQFGCPDGPGCAQGSGIDFNASTNGSISNLDLFRYSQPGLRNVTPGQETYFSIDGGITELYGDANMSTGVYNGDGRQASHFKEPTVACSQADFIGIMNPYLCAGQMAEVTAQDLGAFDAIGWNLAAGARDNGAYLQTTGAIFNVFGVPEPAVWLQMVLGFGLLGSAYRSAQRKQRLTVSMA